MRVSRYIRLSLIISAGVQLLCVALADVKTGAKSLKYTSTETNRSNLTIYKIPKIGNFVKQQKNQCISLRMVDTGNGDLKKDFEAGQNLTENQNAYRGWLYGVLSKIDFTKYPTSAVAGLEELYNAARDASCSLNGGEVVQIVGEEYIADYAQSFYVGKIIADFDAADYSFDEYGVLTGTTKMFGYYVYIQMGDVEFQTSVQDAFEIAKVSAQSRGEHNEKSR